jgi:hypothetical protein
LLNPVTLDGNISTGEWSDATELDLLVVDPSNDLAAYLYLKNDDNYLYIAYDVVGDTQEDNNDYASVGFDTGNDAIATDGEEPHFFQSTPNTLPMMMLYPPGNQVHFFYNATFTDWIEHCNPFDPGQPGHAGLDGNISFAKSPREPVVDHRTYEFRIPLSILGVSAGDTIGFIGASKHRWGVRDSSTLRNSSWPKQFTSDPTFLEYGDLHLSTLPVDQPPNVNVWRPGEVPAEMYQIGNPITVTWNATDDNIMPNDNINITYGSGASWTHINGGWPFYSHVNDGTEIWDTTGVSPGIYYMNISAYDSMGQTTHNVSNYSFELYLETDPPEIENVLIDGSPSVTYSICTIPSTVVLTATVNDTNTGNSNINGANYTIGAQNWLGIDMFASDGSFDSPREDVNITIDFSGWSAGTYDFYVYGWDVVPNSNTTSAEYATLNITDDCAPLIQNVRLNGLPTLTIPTGAGPVWVNATLDDTTTGNTNISSANYTIGIKSWPGTSMNAVSPPFDNPMEDVTNDPSPIDTSMWSTGSYDICVYGSDELGNDNMTGACTILTIAPELSPPEIYNVWIDGSPTQTYSLSLPPPPTFFLNATIDDTATGNSLIGNDTLGGANYTLGPANWPSSQPIDAVDGTWEDNVVEPVTKTLTTPVVGGVYTYCIYGWDQWFNHNTTGLCAQLTIVDDLAPEIENVMLNGMPSLTIPMGTPSVMLTATINETDTGQANIGGANYTVGAQNWGSAVNMDPTDSAWDEIVEDADKTIDTGLWGAGPYDICIYGWDSVIPQNGNTTGSCALLTIFADTTPPEIENVQIDGAPTQTYALSSMPSTIALTATINETNTGGSIIGGANHTLGAAMWPGTVMDPADGSFDSPVEDVDKTIDISSWGVNSYDICVYGWDAPSNGNITGICATLTINDDLQPDISNARVNGLPSATVQAGTTVFLNATVDDSSKGDSNIGGANYTIGAQQWATSQPMSLIGPPTSPTEDFTATIDTNGWAPGPYTVCVYAWDSVPNYNSTSAECASITISIPTDTTPPEIKDVSATPPVQYMGEDVNISANVTDDSGQITVNVSLIHDGSDAGNYSMTYDASTGKYHFEMAYSVLGTFSFTIWANDSSGNWNSSSGSFEIQPKYGTITGKVVDENDDGISGVSMKLVDAGGNTIATVITDSSGNYSFGDVMPGTYSILASKGDYLDSSEDGVTVVAGGTTTVDPIVLSKEISSAMDFWWILLVIVIVVVVIVIILLTRGRKKEVVVEEKPEDEMVGLPAEEMPGVTEETTEPPEGIVEEEMETK